MRGAKEYFPETEKLLRFAESETQNSKNLKAQYSHTYKVRTPILRTAVQKTHTLFSPNLDLFSAFSPSCFLSGLGSIVSVPEYGL